MASLPTQTRVPITPELDAILCGVAQIFDEYSAQVAAEAQETCKDPGHPSPRAVLADIPCGRAAFSMHDK